MLKTTQARIASSVLLITALVGLYQNYEKATGYHDYSSYEVKSANKDVEQQSNSADTTQKSQVQNNDNIDNSQAGNVQGSENLSDIPECDNNHIISLYQSSCDREGSYAHDAAKVFDNNVKSCWSEGVQGNGIGEYIGIKFDTKVKVSGFKIYSGHQKNEELFYKNSVPTVLSVITDEGQRISCKIQDVMGEQSVYFDEPVITNGVKIVVDDVREGSQWQDTCIADIEFF